MNEIVQALVVYLASVGFSGAFLVATVINVIKYALDNGYILNVKRIKEYKSDKTLLKVALFVPGFNIFISAKYYADAKLIMPDLLRRMYDVGFVNEMTEEQKRRYDENPDFLETMRMLFKEQEKDVIDSEQKVEFIADNSDYDSLVKDVSNMYKKDKEDTL